MFYYAQMEVWGLTLCFAWVYSKQLVIPLTQGEDVCTTEPCTAGSWLHAGLPRAQGSHRNPGQTKLRQVLGITTNKMPTLFLPDEIPTAFPLPIQLAIPTGDTTCLSHGQAKVFLCRNKGCLQDFHLSWDSSWGENSFRQFKQEAKNSTEPSWLVVGSQSCPPGNAKMIKLMVLYVLYLISKVANQQPSR